MRSCAVVDARQLLRGSDLYRIDFGSGDIEHLTDDTLADFQPASWPDGKRLSAARARISSDSSLVTNPEGISDLAVMLHYSLEVPGVEAFGTR